MPQKTVFSPITSRLSATKKFLTHQIDKRPLISFFVFLFLLILLAALGNKLRTPAASTVTAAPQVKAVEAYPLSGSPSIAIQAKVEKSGTISLIAQSSGVVQQIRKKEGDSVSRGTTIVSLSSNYQGGNLASLSREVDEKNYQFQVDNFDAQVSIINKQRDIAQKTDTKADELRAIDRQSQDATKDLINLNTDFLNSINSQLVTDSANNADHKQDTVIFQLQQAKSGLQQGLNTLQASQRTLEYNSADDKTPAALSDAQRDLAVQQFDIQQKNLELARDLAGLKLKISQVSESLMYPASPCPGTVERVYVKVGQLVNPGTVLATIKAKDNQATAVALVSQQVAQTISRIDPSTFTIGDKSVSIVPAYVSQEPTDGSLFSVIYHLPAEYSNSVTNNNWLSVKVPISKETSHISSSIPLDSVYQTQSQAYVYVVGKNNQGSASAVVKPVQLGQVYGQFVEVKSGLQNEDQVIVDRNVLEGDLVQVK